MDAIEKPSGRGNRERMRWLEKRFRVGDGRDPIHYGRKPRPDSHKCRRR